MTRSRLRRRLLITACVIAALAAAVPMVAFGVVPLFVRHTLVEPPLQQASPAVDLTAAAPAPSSPPLVLTGSLRRIDAVHYGSGTVSLTTSPAGTVLRFDDVHIAGAPNMYVYLSDHVDGQPGRYTDLGSLKATDGSFNYPVPAGVDLSPVRSVVIWCRAFSVTVTFASLA